MSDSDGAQSAGGSKRRSLFAGLTQRTLMTREGARGMGQVFNALRAPIVVSILGVIVFAIPGQIYEIYRLYAEDFTLEFGFVYDNLRFAIFMAMLYFTSYVLWYVARVLTIIDPDVNAALQENSARGRAARWAPRIIGAAPAFAAAVGMARAEYLRDGGEQTPELYGAAAIAALIGVIRLWSSWRRTGGDRGAYQKSGLRALQTYVRVVFALILVAGVAYLLTQPIAATQIIGSLSLIAFFMVALVFGWAQLSYLYDRFAIPALSILLGMLLLWSFLDLNDNHFIREIEVAQAAPDAQVQDGAAVQTAPQAPADAMVALVRAPYTAKNAFDDWLENRANRQAYIDAGKPYPVYVIAAQGGGLYAAYQSALYLAKLQDACPTFAQHVFAISGVSGGAVGAATFTALAAEHARNQEVADPVSAPCGDPALDPNGDPVSFEKLTHNMLKQDFLSPVISGLLFGDFTARFSPTPIPAFDRARALEAAFELSWAQAHEEIAPGWAPPNRLEDGLLAYWDETGAAPALLMNATEAETGRRIVLSPIEKVNSTLRTYAAAAAPREDGALPDIRLSTAAMVSARFPFITPAASLRLKPQPGAEEGFPKLRLVDGGYYENLGLETASDVILAARGSARRARPARRVNAEALRAQTDERREALRNFRRNIDLRVLVFDLTEDRFRPAAYAFGEVLTPLKALLNTRVSRSAQAQERVRDAFRSPCRYIFLGGGAPPGAAASDEGGLNQVCLPSEVAQSRVWSVSLNDFEYDFQLGWILSRDTLSRIDQQLGDPAIDACAPDRMASAQSQGGPAQTAGVVERQRQAVKLKGFTDGVSITDEGNVAPTTEDALARHNACIGSFVLNQLQVSPGGGPRPGRLGALTGESGESPG
ncbi:MAG: hypothetical protein AAF909_02725 [Pseudomonadota bacterium]